MRAIRARDAKGPVRTVFQVSTEAKRTLKQPGAAHPYEHFRSLFSLKNISWRSNLLKGSGFSIGTRLRKCLSMLNAAGARKIFRIYEVRSTVPAPDELRR